jgi:hypothetical protein
LFTYTPEVKLQLGKVVSKASGFTVKKLRRPIPVYEDAEGEDEDYENGAEHAQVEEQEEEEDEVIELSLDELQREEGRWKVVPNITALALSL